MIGIIAGRELSLPIEGEWRRIDTAFGTPSADLLVGVLNGKDVAFLCRHGKSGIPPHRINHRANICALKELEVKGVIGVNSVGSLRGDISVGTIVIPHDYLSPWSILTFYEQEAVHITPLLHQGLRGVLIDAAARTGARLVTKGVYVQTIGPRLETRAEISMLKRFGDVVGMTMAHEATLCQEMGIPYASICSVDNYCHGIGETPLSADEIAATGKQNATLVREILIRAVEGLG